MFFSVLADIDEQIDFGYGKDGDMKKGCSRVTLLSLCVWLERHEAPNVYRYVTSLEVQEERECVRT